MTVIIGTFTLTTVPVYAVFDPYSGVQCGQGAGSAVCGRSGGNPINTTLLNVTNIIAVIAGVAAVIVIISAGIRLIGAGDNAEDVAKAKRGIIYAAVGIVVIVLGRTIINLVVNGI